MAEKKGAFRNGKLSKTRVKSDVSMYDIARILVDEVSDDTDVKYFDAISKRLLVPHLYSLADNELHCISGVIQVKQATSQHRNRCNTFDVTLPCSSAEICDRGLMWSYTPDEFKLYFRMSRSTVEMLCRKICSNRDATAFTNDDDLFISKLLMTLRLLGSTETLESIGSCFEYSRENAELYCFKMLETISLLKTEFIHWPTDEECKIISNHFNEKHKFPGIIGLIDCFQIHVEVSETDVRNKFNFVLLQVICDHTFRFNHSHVTTKSTDNATLFTESDVAKTFFPSEDYHILGNAMYELQSNLLIPYYDNGHLTDAQRKYNIIHSEIMTITANAKELFKNRFLRLHCIDICSSDMLSTVVTCCCVLHNFTLERDDDFDVDHIIDDKIDALHENGMSNSFKKRNQISALL